MAYGLVASVGREQRFNSMGSQVSINSAVQEGTVIAIRSPQKQAVSLGGRL